MNAENRIRFFEDLFNGPVRTGTIHQALVTNPASHHNLTDPRTWAVPVVQNRVSSLFITSANVSFCTFSYK